MNEVEAFAELEDGAHHGGSLHLAHPLLELGELDGAVGAELQEVDSLAEPVVVVLALPERTSGEDVSAVTMSQPWSAMTVRSYFTAASTLRGNRAQTAPADRLRRESPERTRGRQTRDPHQSTVS